MRAAIITRFGDPDVLEIHDVDTPVPAEFQVLVRIRASALNRADLLQRVGRYPAPNDSPRDIPGMELAGEVAAVGTSVSRWRVGDRVFGIAGGGAQAEYLAVNEDTLSPLPAGITWTDAAAIPEAFITAHDALLSQAGMRAGERVLIHAVGSGVGLAACQLARAWGAIPYGTSRTADKLERAREYGLEDGVVVEGEMEPLALAASRWTGGKGLDIILDLVGGPYVAPAIEMLATRGRLMLVGAVAGSQATIDVRRILGKRLTIRGTVLRARPLEEKVEVARAFERDVLPRLARGDVRPVIDSIFPLEQLPDAHRRMESNQSFGKIVVTM
jgi:putative PIG3 family NAD(P)H quinone oxidoreductase